MPDAKPLSFGSAGVGTGGAAALRAERQESGEAKAERLVREELAKLGRTDEKLAQRSKGDPGKVRMDCRLRQETTMTLVWIKRRLRMGVWTHASPAGRECQ